MKFKKQYLLAAAGLLFMACSDDSTKEIPLPGPAEDPSGGGSETIVSARDEQYRPQIHFTPASNWINDPNGMVYADGVWHLYYQYNPMGNNWGNMSWGHATSKDLIHWEEKPVAMTPNQYGDIFSGSAIVDKENVAGFGKDAILAFYTASGQHQQQCLAYSTDGGITYTQYEGNPVISNSDLPDFRDPKVFWHEESKKWVMCLARGWSFAIDFWGSENLKNWTKLSEFKTSGSKCNIGQWECPDLVKLSYNGSEKWVLIVSNNPGGPAGGSGTQYFVGEFDGTEFKADDRDYPLWLDYGSDNYAGVTWSNAPGGRTVMIGWMNNWNYCGNVPCNPWRSAMTLPRELTLKDVNGLPFLSSAVVKEIENISGDWKTCDDGICKDGDAYEMQVALDPSANTSFRVANGAGEYLEIQTNPGAGKLLVMRTSTTGATSFNGNFSIPAISAPYDPQADELKLHIFTDDSSVEIFNEDGTISITCLVFPSSPYDRIIGVDNVSYKALKSIWK